jgi:hypothetical protein
LPGVEKSGASEQGAAPIVPAAALKPSVHNVPNGPEPVLSIPAPPIVEAPSPLAQPVVYSQPVPGPYSQPGSGTYSQPGTGTYSQPGMGPFVQPASWHMNTAPEAQMQALPPISSNVSCSCSDDDTCTSCDCCPDPLWRHRTGAFFDFLYLRPGNIDYVYAVQGTGPQPQDSPTGPVGRVGFDSSPGYRIGAILALTDCSSIQVTYSLFNADTGDSIAAAPNNVLVFTPGLPPIPNTGSTAIAASASSAIRFQLLELDYRGLLYGTCDSAINYFAGIRYANLKQTFNAHEDTGVVNGLADINTGISFDGFGIGMGLDGMRRHANTGMLIYGRSSASFVAGEYKAQYREVSQFVPNGIIGNNLTDYRVMSILQTELGVGWQSPCGRVRVLGGYQFASWGNALTTASYIGGLQAHRYDNLSEILTFDGFTSRLQVQF